MKKNFDNLYEKLGGTYREENGHLIPNVNIPEQTDYQIGKYGGMHLDYIKQHRRGRYTTLLTEGKLNVRLHEIDLEANEMLESIIAHLAAERGIDEDLKARIFVIIIMGLSFPALRVEQAHFSPLSTCLTTCGDF